MCKLKIEFGRLDYVVLARDTECRIAYKIKGEEERIIQQYHQYAGLPSPRAYYAWWEDAWLFERGAMTENWFKEAILRNVINQIDSTSRKTIYTVETIWSDKPETIFARVFCALDIERIDIEIEYGEPFLSRYVPGWMKKHL